jgi:exodeoxyribonuclease VII large subunit
MTARTWNVDELCAAVADAFSVLFPDELWIRGEIRGPRRSPAGHLYFDLVEAEAKGRGADSKLSIVAFKGQLRGIEAVLAKVGNLELEDGIEVKIRGKLNYYPPQGRVQFLMNAIDPRYTLGQLAAERDRALKALAEEGLLDRNRSLELPIVPLAVGLVTSHDSAAYNDAVKELENSGFSFRILHADARVQGVDAEETLISALNTLARSRPDVILVVRGGGAKTDLVAFDREAVARAVALCPTPVIVGIGHQIDRSLVDEIAHTSLKTPTACAAFIVDRVKEFMRGIDMAASALTTRSLHRLDAAARTMHTTSTHLAKATEAKLRLGDQRLAVSTTRLGRGTQRPLSAKMDHLQRINSSLEAGASRRLDTADHKLEAATALLSALHPDRVLARGFSITRDLDGSAVVAPPLPGTQIITEVAQGHFASRVEQDQEHP